MSNDNKINSTLICLKTGSNAKIISYFDKVAIPYVKISMEIEFEDTEFQVLKAIPIDDIKDQFSYNKPNTYIQKNA